MVALRLAYSTCPNDTFIFGAIAQKLISTEPFDLNIHLADIQQLNMLARKGEVDICKVSFLTYFLLREKYELLPVGSAIGRGCGPLLIARPGINENTDLRSMRIGIPGWDTTAHFLLHYFNPNIPSENKKVLLFHQIIPALLNNEIDVGVIIHESRFIYQRWGLKLLIDLGEYWEKSTQALIPLGAIIIRKVLTPSIKEHFVYLLKQSIEYAFANPASLMPYIHSLAQELEEEVIKAHIKLYVNEYTRDLGTEGNASIEHFFEVANQLNWDFIARAFID